jgi:hypothetical protein
MNAPLDTVIQDLQGAIGLADRTGGLKARTEAWRAHPLRDSTSDATAPAASERTSVVREPGGESDPLDPLTQRLAP